MTITVSSGVTSSGLTISVGDPLIVLWGGVVEDVTIDNGGSATLSSGAIGSRVAILSGGVLLGPGDLDGSDGTNSGSISGVTMVSGSLLFLSGGTGSDVTAIQSSAIVVADGATVTGTVVSDGSALDIDISGSATGTIVGSGGGDRVGSGGSASGDTIQSGGLLRIDPGGSVSGETVHSGGTLDFSGELTSDLTLGTATSTTVVGGVTVSSGGFIELDYATVRSGATVSLAGTSAFGVNVDAGGVAIGPGDIGNGGEVAGSIDGLTVAGVLELKSGGTASGVTLGFVSGQDGFDGVLEIYSGAAATGTVLSGGGKAVVRAGGVASGTVVTADGIETVLGTTTDTVLSGEAFVSSGGVGSRTTLRSGGLEWVYSDGIDDESRVSDGGREVVRGGLASAATVLSGGLLYLWDGTTSGTQVSAGGKELTSSGSVASETTVLHGGLADVLVSGLASGTVVSDGGRALVSSGGVAEATTLLNGGVEYVYSGGTDDNAVVEAGGKQFVSSGGTVLGLSLASGGEVVNGGQVRIAGDGTLAGILEGGGAVIETGGGDLLLSSYGERDFAGKAVISGGTVELATVGALGSGYVEFVEPATGSAVLQIDAADAPKPGGTFANTISNFDGANEDIDLTSIAYVAGASATLTGGKLVLSDGGKTYSFTVAGATAGAYPVLSDGHGGTLIDPQVVAMTHAIAAFTAPSAAGATPISRTTSSAETPFLAETGGGARPRLP